MEKNFQELSGVRSSSKWMFDTAKLSYDEEVIQQIWINLIFSVSMVQIIKIKQYNWYLGFDYQKY
jgi:hypothetical protein